jgi:hypothetical protein
LLMCLAFVSGLIAGLLFLAEFLRIYKARDIKDFIAKRRYIVSQWWNARTHPPAHSEFIFFDWNKDRLTDRARQIIRETAAEAQLLGYLSIEVTGHSDTSGEPEANYELSLSRAQAAAKELVENGIPANSLEVRGYGDTKLRASTAAGVREPVNRRVEIIIRTKRPVFIEAVGDDGLAATNKLRPALRGDDLADRSGPDDRQLWI